MTDRIRVLALLGVLSACGSEAPDSVTTMVTDSAGVEIVSNGREGEVGSYSMIETLRLGVLEGDGPEQFSQVFAVDLNERGDIFVGDNGSGTVRVFNRDGQFEAELGGRGEGPGEVNFVNDVVAFGDTVGIIDWQMGGKMVLYRTDGEMLANWTVRQSDGTRVQPLHLIDDGWLTQVNRPDQFPQLTPGDSVTINREIHLAEFGSTEVGPQLYAIPIYTLYGTGSEGELGRDWSLFQPTTSSGFDRSGRLYVTDSQAYRIDVRNPEGLIRSVRRDYTPRELDESDIEALKEATLHVIDTMSRMSDEQRPLQRTQLSDRMDRQAEVPLPTVMTPLGGLLVSPDGSFWVQVSDPNTVISRAADEVFGGMANFPTSETTWDLFDTEGRYLGSATLPARFRPEAVQGREVVGVWADDLDVEYVVRFEAVPGNQVGQ